MNWLLTHTLNANKKKNEGEKMLAHHVALWFLMISWAHICFTSASSGSFSPSSVCCFNHSNEQFLKCHIQLFYAFHSVYWPIEMICNNKFKRLKFNWRLELSQTVHENIFYSQMTRNLRQPTSSSLRMKKKMTCSCPHHTIYRTNFLCTNGNNLLLKEK